MSMSALVRALGSAAGGASRALDDAEAEKQRKKQDQWADEDRAFNMAERARAVRIRDETAAAAAPVAVQQVEPAGPVMPGAEGPAGQPLAPIPTVQGKGYDSQAAADKAAAEANAPLAVTARMADVAQRNGDPVRAQQLRTAGMQEQTSKLQLNAAERADLDQRFNDDLQSKVNSWDTFDQFVGESAGDGRGGALKIQSIVSADGKKRIVNVVQPDGSLKPTGKEFPNTPDGLAMATAELARIAPEKKLAHLHAQAVLAQQAQHQADVLAETGRHNLKMEGIAQDNTAAKIEIAQMRADAAAAERAAKLTTAGQPGGMTMADLKDGHKGIAATLNADWKTQIESEQDPVKLKALKVARENEIATVQRLYTGAMSAGFALTPEQAIVAFRSGESATQEFKKRDGSGTVKVQGVMYGGRFIPLADNPGATPLPAPAPAAQASGSAPSPASKQATPAEPAKPGMLARATQAVRGVLDANAAEGQQMEAIRARVKEADSGGAPLTAQERATARKFGIAPIKG